MRQRTYRLGAVACAALLAALAVAAPVSAAAPWIIIVDGEQLKEPVYIADYFDNYDYSAHGSPVTLVISMAVPISTSTSSGVRAGESM